MNGGIPPYNPYVTQKYTGVNQSSENEKPKQENEKPKQETKPIEPDYDVVDSQRPWSESHGRGYIWHNTTNNYDTYDG